MFRYLFLFVALVFWGRAGAQQAVDSAAIADSLAAVRAMIASKADSAELALGLSPVRRDTIYFKKDSTWMHKRVGEGNPYFGLTRPTRYTISQKIWVGKEAIFYTIMGLLLFFALIRNGFRRYVQDLFKTFFRTTLRQRQVKEQLLQNPLPSLLFNIFFLLSGGMFLALLVESFRPDNGYNFWMIFVYAVMALIVIYGGKWLMLKFLGWILQAQDATDTYIFVVFTANKVIGITLLPFLILLAFSFGMLSQVALTLAITVVIGLFVYRYFLSFLSVQRDVKISFLHFVLYLAAFELAPLLLINKLLFTFLS